MSLGSRSVCAYSAKIDMWGRKLSRGYAERIHSANTLDGGIRKIGYSQILENSQGQQALIRNHTAHQHNKILYYFYNLCP